MAVPGSNAYLLLAVLQSYAPDGQAQEDCAQVLREMEADGAGADQIAVNLAGALTDGLCHGNWPWVLSRRPARRIPAVEGHGYLEAAPR